MPESPDFEQIAERLVPPGGMKLSTAKAAIAEQLRVIWNARGAADLTKLESELSILMGSTAAGPYVKNLDRALRTLDQ